jgi:hypothetical protein
MKWYKHDTNALADAKIKRLVMRHGAEGYAVYFHCLELIAGDVSKENITFELEHDAEIIADNLKIKGSIEVAAVDKVQDIMNYIIDLGLFQENDNKIFCLKLAKRIDQSMVKSPQLKQLKEGVEKSVKIIEESCQNRREQKRIDNNRKDKIPFDTFWNLYDKKVDRHKAEPKWYKLSKQVQQSILDYLPKYLASTPDKKFRRNAATFFNNKSWENEIILDKEAPPIRQVIPPPSLEQLEKEVAEEIESYSKHHGSEWRSKIHSSTRGILENKEKQIERLKNE